jgi:hypothetical protein
MQDAAGARTAGSAMPGHHLRTQRRADQRG